MSATHTDLRSSGTGDIGGREDLRHAPRFPLPLVAAFLMPDGAEHPGVITDISAVGARLQAPLRPHVGTPVMVRIDTLGQYEATVSRMTRDGFAVAFLHRPQRAVRLAERLRGLMGRTATALPERRIERRSHSPQDDATAAARLLLPEGDVVPCRLLDISTGGASLAVAVRPPIGSRVRLGRQDAVVVRHHPEGIGLAFALQRGIDR